MIPLAVFSSHLSPYLMGLVTPLPTIIIRPLVESLRNDVVVSHSSPPGFDPSELFSYQKAVGLALEKISHSDVETRWSDALMTPAAPMPSDPVWAGARMEVDRRIVESTAPPEDLFWAVSRIGGDVGYYTMNWTWKLRGRFDKLIGGVGLRRGRRHPEELRPGESLDFFRVAEVEPNVRLVLRAEMKVPGTAWLSWTIEPTEGGSRLNQSARFATKGLFGRIYWYAMLPFHAPIFRRMSKRIARTAERRARVLARR